MKTYILKSFVYAIIAIAFLSCCKGGGGGDATLTVFPQHHGLSIPGCTVYIKYNTTEQPGAGTTGYDIQFTAGANDLSVKCTGLKCGNYYVYAVGNDAAISQQVRGGQSVEIPFSKRDGNINVTLPVTE